MRDQCTYGYEIHWGAARKPPAGHFRGYAIVRIDGLQFRVTTRSTDRVTDKGIYAVVTMETRCECDIPVSITSTQLRTLRSNAGHSTHLRTELTEALFRAIVDHKNRGHTHV